VYLCDFARAYVDELTILVCSDPRDPIPGKLRLGWMLEMFPGARVIHCEEALPQEPADDPEHFWPIWKDVLQRYHPEPIDVVFSSEPYGQRLSAEAGARFVPVDEARTAFPVSGRAIRENPYAHWRFLPATVRPYYPQARHAVWRGIDRQDDAVGQLARHFDTVVAPEYGRFHTEGIRLLDASTPEDMRQIVMGHLAGVAAASAARQPRADRGYRSLC
jgi:HTH-type transcriptional repressor of NAD biosynthesis genes